MAEKRVKSEYFICKSRFFDYLSAEITLGFAPNTLGNLVIEVMISNLRRNVAAIIEWTIDWAPKYCKTNPKNVFDLMWKRYLEEII